MSELRILTIEHEHGTGPERFGTWLEEAGAVVEVLRPYLGDPIPQNLNDYDALIVLGGASGPLEDADNPWFPQVRDLLTRSAEGEFPSFNICLGGEMLAAATSATINRRSKPQIGIYDLHTTSAGDEDPVFAALSATEVPAVLFHQEEMTLPVGAELLMTGTDAPVQAFRVGEFAWGTQFHPETDVEQIKRWLSSDPLPLPQGKTKESIAQEFAEADAELVRVHRALARSFVAYLTSRRGSPAESQG